MLMTRHALLFSTQFHTKHLKHFTLKLSVSLKSSVEMVSISNDPRRHQHLGSRQKRVNIAVWVKWREAFTPRDYLSITAVSAL